MATSAQDQFITAPAKGLLSLVGTPIGNLQDASPRVLDTLRRADFVLCEDTRVTSKLLSFFEIKVPLERCDENVIASRIESVLERLHEGKRIAFVSDAGMPGVSDPGQRLVDAALDDGFAVVEVIPGPSAVTCALVASGLPMEHFFFEGFLPRKTGEQKRRLEALASVPGALVFYESPHRVQATLATIAEVFPNRRVALLRELTKLHEECVRGLAPELAERIKARENLKGECVVVVEGPGTEELSSRSSALAQPLSLDDAIKEGLAEGTPKSALAKQLSKQFSQPRAMVYDRVLELAAQE